MSDFQVINSVLPSPTKRSAAADKAAIDGLIKRCDDLVTNAVPLLAPTIDVAVKKALAPLLALVRERQAQINQQAGQSSTRPLITNTSRGRFLLPKGDE